MINFKQICPFFFILIVTALVYANTIHSPWLLDDIPNIIENIPLHLQNLNFEDIKSTFFAKPYNYGELYRPIPCFSFALNWFIGQDNTVGYHLVNILIHLITVVILYKTIQLLLFISNANNSTHFRNISWIALFSSLIWAIHPIQVPAVTYIVQRMTSMATLFFLCSLFHYLQFRFYKSTNYNHFFLCLVFYILAILSKENTVILPLSFVLIEVIFFPNISDKKTIYIKKIIYTATIIILLISLHYAISHKLHSNLFEPVGSRPFSIFERLITQPKVILLYLSLILFPLHSRFSIDHQITISHRLLETDTFFAIVILSLLLLLTIQYTRKYPLIAFGILFYFVNHLVESTIIPLELIFEHRNYLPSLFLPVGITAFFINLSSNQYNNTYWRIIIHITLISIIIFLAYNTYQRNQIWKTETGLWLKAHANAPNNARPLAKLGSLIGWAEPKSEEKFIASIGYLKRSLLGYTPRTSFQHAILGNIGEVYFRYGKFKKSIKYYHKALEAAPQFTNHLYGLAKAYIGNGQFKQALIYITKGINISSNQIRFYKLQGHCFLWEKNYDLAVKSYSRGMKKSVNKQYFFYDLGIALSKAGYYTRAEWYLKLNNTMPQLITLISLLENSLLAQDNIKINQYKNIVLNNFDKKKIQQALLVENWDFLSMPVNIPLIQHILFK